MSDEKPVSLQLLGKGARLIYRLYNDEICIDKWRLKNGQLIVLEYSVCNGVLNVCATYELKSEVEYCFTV